MENDLKREEALLRLRAVLKDYGRGTKWMWAFAGVNGAVWIWLIQKWLWPEGAEWYHVLGVCIVAGIFGCIISRPFTKQMDNRVKTQVDRIEKDFNLSHIESFLLLWSDRESKEHTWWFGEFDGFLHTVWEGFVEKERYAQTRGEWQEK